MMASSMDMPEPVCIINNSEDGKLCINEEAVQILDKITQPVVVVAVAGLYRTGKSYLLNRLAGKDGKHNGFALGTTMEPKTKGIWMWCLPHPLNNNHTLVLLDTEGLGGVEKASSRSSPTIPRPNFQRERQHKKFIKEAEKHDVWIFTLAALLSSTLVYNSKGAIDTEALEKLHHLAAKLNPGAGAALHSQPAEFIYPYLVWTVREFTQQLESEGNQITDDDYLEEALTLKKGNTDDIKLYNLPRSRLQDLFPVRKCFVFERPVSDPDMMDCLEKLPDEDLNPHFLEKANDFCDFIFTESKTKTMEGGLELSGRMLATLAETYVTAINSGQTPCVEQAVEILKQTHYSQAVTEAVGVSQTEKTGTAQLPPKAEDPHDKYKKQTDFRLKGEDELRIVLLGKTGVGKSSTGNTLLGEEVFDEACSANSQTQICKRHEKVINGRRIVVIDTPGLFDTYRPEKDLRKEIITSLVECAPGPHVFILVMVVERYTREDQETVEKLLEHFTDDVVHHTVLLFTHGDDLKENMTIQDFINQSDVRGRKSGGLTLKGLTEKCGNRVHVIDNKLWNQDSRAEATLAELQKLNLSEQALKDITAKMQPEPSDKTPWFNILSEECDNVETGSGDDSEERHWREYRSNSYQLTQLMKSVQNILTVNNGQPYTIPINRPEKVREPDNCVLL